MKTLYLVFFIALVCASSFGQKVIHNDLSDAHMYIEGTKISMVPPQDFTVAANFAGFQQDQSDASIMVLDVPGPFSEMSKGFTEEGLRSQAMNLLASEEITFQDFQGKLLTVEQEAYGQIFKKHILVFGDEKATFFINGTFPKGKSELDVPIQNALLTAYYNIDVKLDPFASVDFKISSEGTALVFAKSMANSLIFNRDGKLPSEAKDQANFIVGKAFSQIEVTDKELFARTRLGQLPIEIDSIISTTSISIDGLDGVEIIADGKNPQNGNREKVYQTILFENSLYYIILGSCEANFEENIFMFQNMAKTFKRKTSK